MLKTDRYPAPGILRYAEALYQLGMTEEEASDLRNVIADTPELSRVLSDPAVEKNIKLRITERIFGPDGTAAGFVSHLVSEGNFSLVLQILDALSALYRQKENTAEAFLTYITPPSEDQLSEMEDILKNKLSCSHVHWNFCRDEKIIGGFILQAGGMTYDFSLRGKLESLRNKVTGRDFI